MPVHLSLRGPLGAGFLFFFLLMCAPVIADEPGTAWRLPPGTVTRVGAPPFEPGARDPGTVTRWVDAARALAAAAPTAVQAGDLWLSIGACLEAWPRQRREALAAYAAARAAYPAGTPRQGLAAARLVALHLADGNAPEAEAAFAWLDGWRGRMPLGAAAVEAEADAALLERLTIQKRLLAADVGAQAGRFREAALALEGLATDLTLAVDDERRARWWEEAARWRARAGDGDVALADLDGALGATQDGGRSAQLALWRLYARFAALDARGDIGRLDPWPGPAFLEAAHEHLRLWQAEPHAATHALTLASAALRAGEIEGAQGLYAVALADGRLLRACAHDDEILEGLLVGVVAAWRSGRPTEALATLDVLARASGRFTPTMDALRIALREATEEPPAEGPSAEASSAGEGARQATPPHPPGLGQRDPPRITPARPADDTANPGEARHDAGDGPPDAQAGRGAAAGGLLRAGLLAGALLLGGVLLAGLLRRALRRVRRRRAARGERS